MNSLYFDTAATTPLDKMVSDIMVRYKYNPSLIYKLAL